MEEKEISIDGLKTTYKTDGSGPVILILHGWNGSSDSWKKVIEILKKDFFVICPDFPGFGKSEPPKDPWSVSDYANWLFKFTQFLNLENFSILAHSFGGRVAIKFSVFWPEKVKKLILCASGGIKLKMDFKTKMIFLIAKIGNAIFTPKPLTRFKEEARNLFYLFLRNRDYAKAKGVMKETMKKIVDEDLLPLLSQIKIKTLLIWGQKDKLVPLKYAFLFKENIKNSELKILPKIGHSPHLENPEKLAEIISPFLKS